MTESGSSDCPRSKPRHGKAELKSPVQHRGSPAQEACSPVQTGLRLALNSSGRTKDAANRLRNP
jgi:hypothetical protein